MDNVLTAILIECWEILKEAAPYVLFGFFAAGVLKAVIPDDMVAKHLGQNGTRSVVKASLFGVPLPLCSCGVIPVAISLRKQGASKGATASFLVSVPETGVDSVAITWALLDPLMTIVRPLAALLTAIITGICINFLPESKPQLKDKNEPPDKSPTSSISTPKLPFLERLKDGLDYAFSNLLKDIGGWLMLGIVIAGVISYVVPTDFIGRYMGGEFISLLLMLIVGIPLYICASASTPIAAALVMKGLSPGAALVFLLAGPATNAATITVITRHLGKAATLVYVSSIAVSSLAIGWAVNHVYAWMSLDIMASISQTEHNTDSIIYTLSAIILIAILLWNYIPHKKTIDPDCGCKKPIGGG